MFDTAIIIPSLNESNRIISTLHDYLNYFQDRVLLVIIDNGSTDGTVDSINQEFGEHDDIEIVEFDNPLGKGGAIYAGFDYVVKQHPDIEVLGFSDADGSTSAQEFQKLIFAIKESDVVVASRWIEGAEMFPKQSFIRRLTGRAFNKYVQIMTGLKLNDTQCGAKVLKRESYLSVADQLVLNGYSFDVELLWRLKDQGFSISEVPITWNDRAEDSKFNTWKSGRRAVRDVFKMRFL